MRRRLIRPYLRRPVDAEWRRRLRECRRMHKELVQRFDEDRIVENTEASVLRVSGEMLARHDRLERRRCGLVDRGRDGLAVMLQRSRRLVVQNTGYTVGIKTLVKLPSDATETTNALRDAKRKSLRSAVFWMLVRTSGQGGA